MSIPKGLILYRAQRHRQSLPINIKKRHYSDKIIIPPPGQETKQYPNSYCRYQKKFSQEMQLEIYDCAPKKNAALAIWSKFPHVTKCKIEPAYLTFEEEAIESIMQGFQTVFKVLKRIKRLEICPSGEPQDRARVSKSLLLLTNLESLTLPYFSYAETDQTMKLFLKAVQSASQRKSWPKLKSVKIQLMPPNGVESDQESDGEFTRSLRELLEFLKGLRAYQNIYACSSFELKVLEWVHFNSEKVDLLGEIAKTITPLKISLEGCKASRFSTLSELVPNFQQLKRVELDVKGLSQSDLEEGVLEKFPNLQELTLLQIDLQLLTQIKALKSLTTLSVRFNGVPDAALDLARMISALDHLRSLELDFIGRSFFHPDNSELKKCPWLYDVFDSIGKKSNLEKLVLNLPSFNFENPVMLFNYLCQKIEDLTNLSDFQLHIRSANKLGDKEVLVLVQCLSKLTKLQELSLGLSKESSFETKMYFALIDCLVKNCPLLSRLWLMISKVEINDKDYELLLREINKLRCLNWISLSFQGGDLESSVGLKTLGAEIRKKRAGGVDYYHSIRRCSFNF